MRAKTICIYGASGNGKTSQAISLAKYIHEKTGKTTRLLSADEGGWAPIADEGMIKSAANKEGIIEVFNMNTMTLLLSGVRKLAMGYWPRIVEEDGKKKRVLVPTPAAEMTKIGLYFIEGLTSLSSAFMGYISKKDNTNEMTKVLYKAPNYEEDGETFGATDKGHYGLVQGEMFNLVQLFAKLPVDMVVWTAHIGQGEERISKQPVYGPKTAGTARTWEIPSWFSDCIHLEKVDSDIPRINAFFRKHTDSNTEIQYLAKSSTGPSKFKRLIEKYDGGFIPLEIGEGLDKYLRELE